MIFFENRHAHLRVGQYLRATIAATALSIAIISGNAFAATITVTGTGDTVAVDGTVTLREAIESINAGANANADVVPVGAYGTADQIDFNIGGTGVQTIAPTSFLPNTTKPLFINGYSQPGSSPNTNGPGLGTNAVLLIELNLGGSHSLTLGGGNSTVRGLVINRAFLTSGIVLINNGGNVIAGNFIGTNPAGTAAGPGNQSAGVDIGNVPNNTVGGLAPADRNLISANQNAAIFCCAAGVANNIIQNNLIGTDATGMIGLGTGQGISLTSGSGNLVGSTDPNGRNVVAASGQYGISLLVSTSNNTVQGNYVGTNAAGTAALPNEAYGIYVVGNNNMIGGTAPGAGNLISGNVNAGIFFNNQGGTGNTVQGNFIGTDATGTVGIAGQSSAGVNVGAFSSGNLIGGTAPGTGNVIAFNNGNGVLLGGGGVNGAQNSGILGNRIYSNAMLGIKLGTGGGADPNVPLPNDPGDADVGANGLQNYPILTSAVITGTDIAISGTLNSNANTAFRVELFSNTSCDAAGNGEGQTFLGFANATTDGGGNVSFGPVTFPLPAGQKQITATATSPTNNTSEFSPCILAVGPPAVAGAVSRKSHGIAGTIDLPLTFVAPPSVNPNPTIEPRLSTTSTIVMTFDSAVISASVAITEGVATVGTVTFSGNDVIVPLTGVLDQQYVTVSATNVSSAVTNGGSGSVRIGFLLGDVNQSRVVTVSDVGLVNVVLAQSVTAANFLRDVNASGTLTVSDKGITNTKLTNSLPPPGGTTCGNSIIEGSEQCDGANLGGQTCQSLGFVGGTLSCTNACIFRVSACIP